MDVRTRMQKHIDECEALQIPARFAREIESRTWAIDRARATIARWEAMQR